VADRVVYYNIDLCSIQYFTLCITKHNKTSGRFWICQKITQATLLNVDHCAILHKNCYATVIFCHISQFMDVIVLLTEVFIAQIFTEKYHHTVMCVGGDHNKHIFPYSMTVNFWQINIKSWILETLQILTFVSINLISPCFYKVPPTPELRKN